MFDRKCNIKLLKSITKRHAKCHAKHCSSLKQREVCPSVWFGNLEIDETTDQKIVDIYQQVFEEDPVYPFARGHLR